MSLSTSRVANEIGEQLVPDLVGVVDAAAGSWSSRMRPRSMSPPGAIPLLRTGSSSGSATSSGRVISENLMKDRFQDTQVSSESQRISASASLEEMSASVRRRSISPTTTLPTSGRLRPSSNMPNAQAMSEGGSSKLQDAQVWLETQCAPISALVQEMNRSVQSGNVSPATSRPASGRLQKGATKFGGHGAVEDVAAKVQDARIWRDSLRVPISRSVSPPASVPPFGRSRTESAMTMSSGFIASEVPPSARLRTESALTMPSSLITSEDDSSKLQDAKIWLDSLSVPITTLVQDIVMKQIQKMKEPWSNDETIRTSVALPSPSSFASSRVKDPHLWHQQIEVAVSELRRDVAVIGEQMDEQQKSAQVALSASEATIACFRCELDDNAKGTKSSSERLERLERDCQRLERDGQRLERLERDGQRLERLERDGHAVKHQIQQLCRVVGIEAGMEAESSSSSDAHLCSRITLLERAQRLLNEMAVGFEERLQRLSAEGPMQANEMRKKIEIGFEERLQRISVEAPRQVKEVREQIEAVADNCGSMQRYIDHHIQDVMRRLEEESKARLQFSKVFDAYREWLVSRKAKNIDDVSKMLQRELDACVEPEVSGLQGGGSCHQIAPSELGQQSGHTECSGMPTKFHVQLGMAVEKIDKLEDISKEIVTKHGRSSELLERSLSELRQVIIEDGISGAAILHGSLQTLNSTLTKLVFEMDEERHRQVRESSEFLTEMQVMKSQIYRLEASCEKRNDDDAMEHVGIEAMRQKWQKLTQLDNVASQSFRNNGSRDHIAGVAATSNSL